MAFQTGTKVDPRLMQADYSGFTNAASIQASALANLGAQIGGGIEKYYKKKQDAADDEAFAKAVEPYLMEMTGGDADEAKDLGKFLRKDPAAFSAIQEMRSQKAAKEKDDMTREVLNAVGSGALSAKEAIARGVSAEAIKDYTGATEGQTAKQFTESVTLAAEAVNGTYDPAQNGIVVDDTPYIPGGKRLIPLSDPMFANYFATAKGQNMTGQGFDVLGTNNSAQGNQGQVDISDQPIELGDPKSSSSPNLMSGVGSAISSIAQTPGNLDPTNPTISTGVPMEYTEPSLDISEVAGGAVSRISDYLQRKLKENEGVRRSTYGQ
tara:strand:- start:322 stop:1290 length:969 start_codon:yes stop_codon:yes gene_type:complete